MLFQLEKGFSLSISQLPLKYRQYSNPQEFLQAADWRAVAVGLGLCDKARKFKEGSYNYVVWVLWYSSQIGQKIVLFVHC